MESSERAVLDYQPQVIEAKGHERRSLVEELQHVLIHANGLPITVREASDELQERGPGIVMVLLMLPFLFPLPLWGLSTPVGLAVAFYGITVMLHRPPWLPDFIGKRTLKFAMLEKLVTVGTKWGRRLEKVLKPRLKFMLWPMVNAGIGLSLIACGLFLALPLPIPFSNAVPAVAIILLLLGTIERDGIFVIAGQVVTFAIGALCGYVGYLIWVYGFEKGIEAARSMF